MFSLRKSEERGHAEHGGWLDSFHTFSFADYYDPEFMGFRVLRVINDDRIAGGGGFPTHPHRDMEIVTYVIEGALEHRDTLGNAAVIRPGEVQRMSAGTGIRHSEFNSLKDQTTRLLQIWILPGKQGIAPGYEQKSFEDRMSSGDLILTASADGRDGSVTIHQDVDLHVAKVSSARRWSFTPRPGRYGWIQMVKGKLLVGDRELSEGDGLAFASESQFEMSTPSGAEFLLFDLP